jgi:tetratricopeptide (TPR) repeat protein
MDQLVVLQEIFESYMRGGFSRPIDPKSISGDCADLVAALLESFEEGQIDEKICTRLLNCLSDIYDIKRLGDICRLAGHLGIAARCYNKALSQTTDQHVRSVLYNNLGQVHARQGYLGRALHYYEKAAEGFSSQGDSGSLAQVLGNMGSAYRSSESYEEALESCRKSLEIFRELEDESGVAQMTGSIGRIHAEMGEYDLALQEYEKSLADFEQLGDQRQVAWILNRMGRVNAEIEKRDVAIGYYHRSMEIFEEIGQRHNAGVVLANFGRLHLDRGDLDLAADHLETSLDLIRKNMQPVRANAVSWLSAVRAIRGRDLHQQALHTIGGDEDGPEATELFIEASSYYAGAAECLDELAGTPGVALPDLGVDAGIARLASSFVILEMETEPEMGVKLAEEGVAALNSALSRAEDSSERPSVEALRRSMMGMKETWRLSLIKEEPWKLSDVASDATEHFTQAILQLGSAGRGCKEACGQLLPAFKTLGRFIASILKGEPPADLSETMAYLKRAESAFELAAPDLGMISPFQIREARMMASRLEEAAGSGRDGQGLLLEDYQRTLLLMGRVLTRAALTEASLLDTVRTWNESMNLIEETPLGRQKPRTLLQADGKTAAGDEPSYPIRPPEGSGPRPPPLIRPIEEVLSFKGGPSKAGGAEPLGLTEVARNRPPSPGESDEGARDGGEGQGAAPPIPLALPSAEESLTKGGCNDLPAFGANGRDPLRFLARFASGVGRDLGDLAFRRGEVRTPRLQRWSYRPLLRALALRGLRLLAAALFLFILLDLTHYLI